MKIFAAAEYLKDILSLRGYSVLSDILVKNEVFYRWKGDQMFYLLVKVSFAYLPQ